MEQLSLSTSGSLKLESRQIDRSEFFSWDATWDLYPGASLERANPGWSANDPDSWFHSIDAYGNGDLGTPGNQNSVFPTASGRTPGPSSRLSFTDLIFTAVKAFRT